MKYRTIIEIKTDAEDKDEAMEIVGDYLSGNLISGVEMKCVTGPVSRINKNLLSIVLIFSLFSAVLVSAIFMVKPSNHIFSRVSCINAIQPPLKTSNATLSRDSDFKKEWEAKQQKQALDHIKKVT